MKKDSVASSALDVTSTEEHRLVLKVRGRWQEGAGAVRIAALLQERSPQVSRARLPTRHPESESGERGRGRRCMPKAFAVARPVVPFGTRYQTGGGS